LVARWCNASVSVSKLELSRFGFIWKVALHFNTKKKMQLVVTIGT